jgi:hypothetical protein
MGDNTSERPGPHVLPSLYPTNAGCYRHHRQPLKVRKFIMVRSSRPIIDSARLSFIDQAEYLRHFQQNQITPRGGFLMRGIYKRNKVTTRTRSAIRPPSCKRFTVETVKTRREGRGDWGRSSSMVHLPYATSLSDLGYERRHKP